MKNSLLTTLALAAASFLTTAVFAQSTWETVDDFQYAPGKGAAVAGMAAANDGVVFSACMGSDAAGLPHGFVRRSLDGGQNWISVLDLPGTSSANCWNVSAGSSGLVFATASINAKNWVTARSADGGTTWTIVDSWLTTGSYASPYAAIEDASGRVFAGGWVTDAQNKQHFLTRRSLDGGTTWATVDDVVPSSGQASVWAMTATPAGVFAAGRLSASWIVRRSANGGQTWTTVDQYTASNGAFPYGMASDASGHLYVTGTANISVSKRSPAIAHWITRRSTNGGATWTIVDDFVPGTFNAGRAITVAANGRVFAAGYTLQNGVYHWVTRTSLDGGAAWFTTDDVIQSGIGHPRGAAADAVGNVFIGGQANGTDGVAHAVVRKLPTP